MPVVSESTLVALREYLKERRELFKSICKKFEIKYGNIDRLRKKIEEEGVPRGRSYSVGRSDRVGERVIRA